MKAILYDVAFPVFITAVAFLILVGLGGCQIRPTYDSRTGEANVLAADNGDKTIDALKADNDKLRDLKQSAAFAIVEAKASNGQPVTAADIEAWQAQWQANDQERTRLISEAQQQDRLAATTQPASAVERAALVDSIRANNAERERLLQVGKTLQAKAASATPVTQEDLAKLYNGIQLDNAERQKIAEIAGTGKANNNVVRTLGLRSIAVGQQESQFLKSLGLPGSQ